MAAQVTPSKQVSAPRFPLRVNRAVYKVNASNSQAASAVQNLSMDSPVKKLDFSASNKENAPFDADIATLGAEMDTNHKTTMDKKEDAKAVARTPKEMEADEPLLQDNPQRFVLFPIKYHEVRNALRRVKWNTC